MRRGCDEQDGWQEGGDAPFELMFRQGLELVTTIATHLRQPRGDACASNASWETQDPQARAALLTWAMELNSALQLLRATLQGHMSATLAGREAENLLHRLTAVRERAEGHAGPDMMPLLLRLPAHQLASLQASLIPHLASLAQVSPDGLTDAPATAQTTRRYGSRSRRTLHLVPRPE